jgi:prepilin peptidase CpaA
MVWLGIPHIGSALGGFLSCGAIMLVCYVFFPGSLGGGDVKLLAMLGAFVGPAAGLEIMLWTFVLGGCLGLVTLVWKVGLPALVLRMWTRIKSVVTAGAWLPLTDHERAPLQLHLFLSPAAMLATVIVQLGLLDRV